MYVIISDLESSVIEIEKCFDTLKEAKEYMNKIVNERKDLFGIYDNGMCDDTFVFDNDDIYYIRYCNKE